MMQFVYKLHSDSSLLKLWVGGISSIYVPENCTMESKVV